MSTGCSVSASQQGRHSQEGHLRSNPARNRNAAPQIRNTQHAFPLLK
jgi:hypothetical protein